MLDVTPQVSMIVTGFMKPHLLALWQLGPLLAQQLANRADPLQLWVGRLHGRKVLRDKARVRCCWPLHLARLHSLLQMQYNSIHTWKAAEAPAVQWRL